MQTTNDFLDAVKARYGLPSDYAVAKKLEMSRERISKYRHKGGALGEDAALKVAELLELDPAYVLASVEAERSQSEAARSAWERLADRLKRGGVAAALLLLVATPAPTPASAAQPGNSENCILCKIRRALSRARSRLARPGRFSRLYAAFPA